MKVITENSLLEMVANLIKSERLEEAALIQRLIDEELEEIEGIESFWALLKRGYYGTHHWWSKKHLNRYVSEFAYRQNTIGLTGEPAIAALIRKAVGKRLTYASLIA